ncbi:MAG: branched-chain amino acid aminotransferase [Phycisphaerales bacterium]|nr:branched-chain amino acid aminotransferase [Phycisphaerales bacterium]
MGSMVYLNGEILDVTEARVAVTNPGLLHGVGLFETLRSYAGRPFRLDEHLVRMRSSAEKLNMPLGNALERVPEAIGMVLQANELTEARIRFAVTPPGAHDPEGETTLLVAAEKIVGYPPELYEKGMTVFICTNFRQSAQDPLAGHKTLSYLPRLIALRDAQNRQCGEALWFTPENMLAEGCISNVFLVKGGCLHTPPLDTPILPGVTRAAVLELAEENGIAVEQDLLTINNLLDAEEVFLTNAIMEIMPVTRVERHSIGDEQPGLITRKLAEAYQRLTHSL